MKFYQKTANLRITIFSWSVVLSLLLAVGCQTVKYESAFLKEVTRKDQLRFTMSAAQLRLQLDELIYLYSGTIEQAADQIISANPDRKVQQHALLWKINAIPTAQRAIFYPDPAVALIDTIALSMQMASYFESGQGRIDLGPAHIPALTASRKLENATVDLANKLKQDGDISRLRGELQSWVARHPIAPDFIHRSTVIPELNTLFPEKQLGTLDMVGSLALSASDIAHQFSVNLDLMPRQVRWQTELLLTAAPGEAGVGSDLASLVELGSQLEQMMPILSQAPDLIVRERDAVLAALARERTIVLEALHRERIEFLADIDRERRDTLAHLVREREAVMGEFRMLLAAEREAALKSLDETSEKLLMAAEAAGGRLTVTALEGSKQVVDHFMLRLAQLLASAILLSALIAIFFRKRFVRKT